MREPRAPDRVGLAGAAVGGGTGNLDCGARISGTVPRARTNEGSRRGRHGRAGINGGRRRELGQRPSHVEVRCVAQRDGVHLTGGHQPAKHFAHLAASGQRSQEQLDLFHAGGDDGLQVDGSEHRDRGDLRGGCAFGNGLLEADAQQLPLGGACRERRRRE